MTTLTDLRDLRRQGYAPRAVFVAVDMPQHVANIECLVYVRPQDEPRRMDWRPLVGLRTAFLFPLESVDRGLSACKAASEAGCIPVGTVGGGCVSVLEDEFAAPLKRAWEVLCNC